MEHYVGFEKGRLVKDMRGMYTIDTFGRWSAATETALMP